MRKLFTLVLVFFVAAAAAQQYNNEWIDFTRTYYKIRIADSGVYRINQATLNSAGLGAVPAEQFKLWRNGKEVPLYTSVASGVMPVNGYIEFWGEPNDGKADLPLYIDLRFQHSDRISLQTDTAVYFLTSSVGANARMVESANNVNGNTLAPEPFFMYTAGMYFKETINAGLAAVVGEYVYSSSYDQGEFWSTREITPAEPRNHLLNNLAVFPGGPDASINFGAAGNASNTRTVRVSVNGSLVKESRIDYFNDTVAQATLPLSIIASNTASVQFLNSSATSTDRMVVSFYEITYPRQFNFAASRQFAFELNAKNQGYYLEINNFNFGGQPPVLYDLTFQQRYTAQVSGTVLKFVLPGASAKRKLVLISEDASNIRNITSMEAKTFTNFKVAVNQGNYLIISNPLLYKGANGANPVEQYKNYRSSQKGGSFNAHIYDIDELVDQFAFGIKKHPLSIKNFLRFARASFPILPRYVFLIGRGVAYNEYRYNQSDPLADKLNLVPSFGFPASDNLLSSAGVNSAIPLTPIGRLSVVNAKEIEDYLEKVNEYENMQQTAPNTIAGRLWMKNSIEVTGASDTYLGTVLCNYMEGYKRIMEDTLCGGSVTIFCKNSTNPVEQLSSDRIAELFHEGLSLVTYFGHSSATTLEFNLDNPQNYNNPGKYPVFSVNGCNAGNFFSFDPQRFTFNETLSEKFVLAKQRGGIAFIASTHFGIVNYLNVYIESFFRNSANVAYGSSLGELNKDALQKVIAVSGPTDFYGRLHSEEITLHGDPALIMNYEGKTDYVVEEPQVKISPSFISIAEEKFNLGVKLYNLGRAVKDSITIEIKRQYPDAHYDTLYRKRIRGIYYSDSVNLVIPVVATRDKGLNRIIVTVDADNNVPEVTEANNTVTKEFFIYEDEAKPVSPYNFSIVNDPALKLYASTANPFSTSKQYAMEIDTTELFNSPSKVSRTINSIGGILEFQPGIAFKDSTVYYWRVALVPSNNEYRWNGSSFIFMNAKTAGFNQSHYYQHQSSKLEQIYLDTDRKWKFDKIINNLFLRNTTYPTGSPLQADFVNTINGQSILGPGCSYDEIIIQVIDPVTFKPWQNDFSGSTGLYKSALATCGTQREYNFDYLVNSAESRKNAMDFLDLIPDGAYVVVRNNNNPVDSLNTYINAWKADAVQNGPGRSLYHKLFQQGFVTLDSFNRARAWIFMYRKNRQNEFASRTQFSESIYDHILVSADCPTPDTIGFITSPKFGPARNWKQLHWRGSSQEPNSADNPMIDIIGVDSLDTQTKLYTIGKDSPDFDVSAVDARKFPYIQLKMRNVDSITLTPYQLSYWRVDFDAVPEGALAPNLYFTTKDSLEIGEKLNFGIAFKNISQAAFDSIRIKLYVIDKDNITHVLPQPKMKALLSGDSLVLKYEIDTRLYPGINTLYVDFNPDNDQPEQYHYNNFLYRNFYVKPDKTNPLLDVTFDGTHILNRDIVSSKPRIQIKLKDEAKYMLLNDTSLLTVQVRYADPARTLRTFKFDNDTLRFIPAQNGTDNTASIEFSPFFSQQYNAEGDDYDLIVTGKDRSGNKAGQVEYKVSFRVINKPMISNLLNYPNPFTTSTAFVFTITGSEIPQNMKIQILTVTGKIVREITKEELGTIHIGRNITDYKWNGTDQFGQRLANGVYLYRVVTTLNGRQMEKFKTAEDDTDKFFTRGYGKMYLMR